MEKTETLRILSDSQEEAINKLKKYRVGALFMEQGTGKTLTAIELVNSTNCDYVLYIAPYRVINPDGDVSSIKDEVAKWGGFNAPVEYLGVESLSNSDRIFLEHMEALSTYKRPFIVVDESIKIKNLESKRTKRVIDLGKKARYKLILNGTPITKDLLDLYAQMYFLSPKIIGMDYSQFKHTFCRIKTVSKYYGSRKVSKQYITGYENVDYLHSLISNFVYRCSLTLQVEQDHEVIRYKVEDREEYDRLKDYFLSHEVLTLFNNNFFLSMTQAMQRSYALDERKILEMDRLMYKLRDQKTLVFCKYIDTYNFCKERYKEAKVLSFQKSSLGLNLQEYNNTVYFDKVWDYYLMEQSKSRTYRRGQVSDCNYYYLTSDLGLDRLIDLNIGKKVGMSEYLKEKTIKEIESDL